MTRRVTTPHPAVPRRAHRFLEYVYNVFSMGPPTVFDLCLGGFRAVADLALAAPHAESGGSLRPRAVPERARRRPSYTVGPVSWGHLNAGEGHL